MAQVPLAIVSHKRQVCSLYKRALRNLESWYDRRWVHSAQNSQILYNEQVHLGCFLMPISNVYRYRAVQLRARFDENRSKDLGEGIRLLACGQRELFETRHFQPRNCKQIERMVICLCI